MNDDMNPNPASAEIEAAFARLWSEWEGMITRLLRARRVRDWEDAVQTVALRLWAAYPRMYAAERHALANGQPSPHHWRGWIATITQNVANDFGQREKTRRRTESLEQRQARAERPSDLAGAQPPQVPAVDAIADPRTIDPAQAAADDEIARLLAAKMPDLTPEERRAARHLLLGRLDDEAALRTRDGERAAAGAALERSARMHSIQRPVRRNKRRVEVGPNVSARAGGRYASRQLTPGAGAIQSRRGWRRWPAGSASRRGR